LRVTVLASGSSGNSILVEADGTRILIDAGLAAADLARRLDRSATGTRLDDVQALVVTHEHSDHIGGAQALASAGVTVYATEGTARAAHLTGTQQIIAGEKKRIGALELDPITLPHDAAEPIGIIVSDGEATVGILTDCGYAAPEVAAAYAGVDLLLLETNHDGDMLRAGSYPPFLKRRIGGSRGHLSNDQAAEMVRLMRKPAAQVVVLAHISKLNNRPRLAKAAVERALVSCGVRPRILVAPQERPLAPLKTRKGRVEILPSEENRQLTLCFPD
jgi:phosphoribosyl 1,2-cyclic phosphodiesterase